MQADGTVKGHQKISATEGQFGGILEDSDAFGRAIASLGDVDGDGVTDLAVGTYGDDDGGQDAGAVWILFLTAEGKVKHEQKISDVSPGLGGDLDKQDLFGTSLAALGDIDSDGVPDLAIGSPLDDEGGFDRGAVWIVTLQSTGEIKKAQKIASGVGGLADSLDDGDYFGDAIARVGDLDADGVQDLVVGASGTDDNGADQGALWVLFMGQDHQVTQQVKIGVIAGGLAADLDDYDFFGSALSPLGATDGTAEPRLLVGAWGDDDGGADKGAAYVLTLDSYCSVCGNGKKEPWEVCDDGNLTDGDGCSSSCGL